MWIHNHVPQSISHERAWHGLRRSYRRLSGVAPDILFKDENMMACHGHTVKRL